MERLRKTQDFSSVYHYGRSKADHNLVLYRLKKNHGEFRIGISVSKKVGNSVIRHKIKRRIREAARLHEESFPAGYDYVVIARKASAHADYTALEQSLLKLADILGAEKR